jgi:hypothetical protein
MLSCAVIELTVDPMKLNISNLVTGALARHQPLDPR